MATREERKRLYEVAFRLRSELAKSGNKPTHHSRECENELLLSLKSKEAVAKFQAEFDAEMLRLRQNKIRG
jgi:hypothetical protein